MSSHNVMIGSSSEELSHQKSYTTKLQPSRMRVRIAASELRTPHAGDLSSTGLHSPYRAQNSPHALHKVLRPSGPFLHSDESEVRQFLHILYMPWVPPLESVLCCNGMPGGSPADVRPIGAPGGIGCEDMAPPGESVFTSSPVLFFSFLAHLKPHALHRVLGPLGPFLHSGESSVPQSAHTYSSATFSFFFSFFELSRSLSRRIAIPASPLISAGDVSPVEIP